MGKQRKRWNAAYAEKILERADAHDSDRAFAARERLKPQRLSRWRKRLGRPRGGVAPRAQHGADEQVEFVEVTNEVSSMPVIEVLLANGRRLRCTEHVDPERLARLADALERSC